MKTDGRGASAPTRGVAAKRALFCASMLGGLVAATAAAAGPALPTGGVVKAGSATISALSGGSLTVNQTSSKAIIDWSSFGIGQGGTVQFDNGSGATLNRVTGSNISSIDGLLSATGSIYLINPNGVIVGKTGVVNTGGSFVASTLDVANSSFLAGGPLTFSGPSTASVVNLGKVSSLGGNVGMIAATVSNSGSIAAPKGDVGLIAGTTVTMDDADNDAGGLFSVQVGDGSTSATNTGAITAAAVELRAQQGNVYALAGNTGGVIDATGIDASGGTVKLISTGGTTTVTGTLSAQGANGTGGQIETSGETLDLGAATVKTHGGSWLLDPTNLIINSTAASAIDSALASGNVTLATSASGAPTESGVTGATGDTATGNGDIVVQSALTWSSGSTLTLNAYNGLYFDAPITVTGAGKVAFSYGLAGLGLAFAEGSPLQFTGTPGSGQALSINGTAYTLIYSLAGGGATGTTDLEGIDHAGDSGHYALALSLTNSTAFTAPLLGASSFNGTLEGLGNTITGLTIGDAGASVVGLIGKVGALGVVRDIGLLGGSVAGGTYVGTLAGANDGLIVNSFATAAVSGTSEVGGLVGGNGGSVKTSYAAGKVSGTGQAIGGLVGFNFGGSILSSYATGAVSGGSTTGGLVGLNYGSGGSIQSVYATGAVSGSSYLGGLIGYNQATGISGGYFDTQTSGRSSAFGKDTQSQSGNVTGLTTAQFQNGGASGLGALYSASVSGLYPFLTALFPNDPQVVTGTVYSDLGLTPVAATTVNLIGNGVAAPGAFSTGANGYYYAVFAPGTLASNHDLLVYDAANAATEAYHANVSEETGVNLYGNTVTVPEASLTLSGATTLSAAKTTALAADGGVSAAASAINNATGLGLANEGASFTIDAAPNLSGGTLVITTPSGDPLTVAATVTVSGSQSLGLLSGGALLIDAPINVTGAGHMTLGFSAAGTVSYAEGDSLTFSGAPGGGQTLSINGQAYTLLYSLANSGSTGPDTGATDIAGIDNNTAAGEDAGFYALANNLTAPATAFASALAGTTGVGLSGVFDGLGHTIGGLTISSGIGSALIEIVSSTGVVRDIGLVGVTITGADDDGALVGINGGTVENSYATGTVSGSSFDVGGLVGVNLGTVETSYAVVAVSSTSFNVGGLVGGDSGLVTESFGAGSVSGANTVGGLVGETSGTVSLSYATGAVSGAGPAGGLIGLVSGGVVSNSYFDTQTTGQSSGVGSGAASGTTGENTAALQTTNGASGLGTAFGYANGLYPYLQGFFPTGPQVVTGTAYSDAGVTPLAATPIGVANTGGDVATAVSGADGYYYAFAPVGSLPTGQAFLAYDANAATVPFNSTGASLQSGVNLYAQTVTTVTSATTLSSSGLDLGFSQFLAESAADTPGAAAAINATTQVGVIATGASFTVDQPVSGGLVVITQTGDPLTVTGGIGVYGSGSLGLLSGGALAIDGLITVNGGEHVNLTTSSTSGVANLSFAQGDSLQFTGTPGSGQALSINGQAYTLLYSVANPGSTTTDTGLTDIAGIDNNNPGDDDGGHYALALSVTAPSTTFTSALVGANITFGGTLEGLGNTIAGLTLSSSSAYQLGLVGLTSYSAVVRDLGLVGGSTSGSSFVGALVGYNEGLVANSFATGSVTGTAEDIGGLVGENYGTVETSYATGAVSGGSVYDLGGLAGENEHTIEASFATGAVTLGAGGRFAGGLVGYDDGTVTTSFATGAVSGGSYHGGLIGALGTGTISNAFFDTQTTGQTAALGSNSTGGVTGLTTAQLQSNAGGYMANLGAAFGGGTGGLYPYLVNFFPNGGQALTGTVYSDGGATPLAGTGVGAIVGDSEALGPVTSGANGYYYIFGPPGALPGGTAALLVYDTADAATLTTSTGATVQTGVNLYGQTMMVSTAATTLSGSGDTLASAKTAATAADDGVAAAAAAISGATGLGLNATGASFTVNQAVSSGLVILTPSGDPLTVASAISLPGADVLGLLSGGALDIDAPISVTGAGEVALAYGAGGLGFDLGSSSFKGSLSYAVGTGEGVAGQALVINGTPYTLLHSMSDVAGLDDATGDYALAATLTATGTYAGAVVSNFSGTLEGLGNSISGLTIAGGAGSKIGLIGKLNSGGVVRDLGLLGGSVTGLDDVGGLVGVNNGAISDVLATGNVTAAGGDYVGGLVGDNGGGGTITGASASKATVSASGGVAVGGLVGYNSGTVSGSSASDAVDNGAKGTDTGGLVGYNAAGAMIASGAASGIVSGGAHYTGGLVGYNAGAISGTSTASGAVSAPAGAYYVGGIAGFNAAGGTITGASASDPTVSASDGASVGGLVGQNAGTISNDAAYSGTVGGGIYVGGLVGYSSSSVTGSTTSDTVSNNNASGQVTGGLVGDNAAGATITSSTASGAVSGGTKYTGGLAGYNAGGVSGTSSASGNVSAASSADVGGLVGENVASGTITGATASGNVSAAGSDYVGGLVGANAAGGTITSASTSGGTVNADGAAAVGGLVGYNSGTVTGSSSSEVVANNGAGSDTGGLVGYNGGTISSGTASGTVTGGATNTGGLAGDNAGTIQGASLAKGNVSASGGSYVGGFVGDNVAGATITDAAASGKVTGLDDVGGFAGANGGAISVVFATGAISAPSGDYVGGLVGDNASGATLSSAFATGAVSASSGVAIGGLVGLNAGTISNTYAYAGAVSGGTYVGGLVGDNDGGVSTSWSSGAVSGTSSVGGSIGKQAGGTLSDLYWDEGTSGKTLGVGNGSSTGVTGIGGTTGLSPDAQATYAGFNFSTTWTIKPGTSRAYLQAPKPATPPN